MPVDDSTTGACPRGAQLVPEWSSLFAAASSAKKILGEMTGGSKPIARATSTVRSPASPIGGL